MKRKPIEGLTKLVPTRKQESETLYKILDLAVAIAEELGVIVCELCAGVHPCHSDDCPAGED